MSDMARYNFHMGVHTMDLFKDDADFNDLVYAVGIIKESIDSYDGSISRNVSANELCLASKAINVVMAALISPLCDEDGFDLQDHIAELRTELNYHL